MESIVVVSIFISSVLARNPTPTSTSINSIPEEEPTPDWDEICDLLSQLEESSPEFRTSLEQGLPNSALETVNQHCVSESNTLRGAIARPSISQLEGGQAGPSYSQSTEGGRVHNFLEEMKQIISDFTKKKAKLGALTMQMEEMFALRRMRTDLEECEGAVGGEWPSTADMEEFLRAMQNEERRLHSIFLELLVYQANIEESVRTLTSLRPGSSQNSDEPSAEDLARNVEAFNNEARNSNRLLQDALEAYSERMNLFIGSFK